MKNYQETNTPAGLKISFIERPLRAHVLDLEYAKARADLWKGFRWGWLDDEPYHPDKTDNIWRNLVIFCRILLSWAALAIPRWLQEQATETVKKGDKFITKYRWPNWVSGYVGMALTFGLLSLCLTLFASLLMAIAASYDPVITLGTALAMLLGGLVSLPMTMLNMVLLYLMALVPLLCIRLLALTIFGGLVYKREFKREISFRVDDYGCFQVESEFDALTTKAYGGSYKAGWFSVEDIVSVEADSATAFQPELSHAGDEKDKSRASDLTWAYQIRAFDYDGESHLLMNDSSGVAFARRFRLRLEGYFKRCLIAADTWAYMIESKNNTKENLAVALSQLRIPPTKTRRDRRARVSAMIPIDDRL